MNALSLQMNVTDNKNISIVSYIYSPNVMFSYGRTPAADPSEVTLPTLGLSASNTIVPKEIL